MHLFTNTWVKETTVTLRTQKSTKIAIHVANSVKQKKITSLIGSGVKMKKLTRRIIDLKSKESAHEIIKGPRLPPDSEAVTLIKYIRELEKQLELDECVIKNFETDMSQEINGAVMLALIGASINSGDKICCNCGNKGNNHICNCCHKHNMFEYFGMNINRSNYVQIAHDCTLRFSCEKVTANHGACYDCTDFNMEGRKIE